MNSPARRHLEQHQAAAAAAQAGAPVAGPNGYRAPPMPEAGEPARVYRELLIALGEDLRQLHNIQSIERKIEAKRTMAPRYRDWVLGALSAEVAAQDEIVVTMLAWTIDTADWDAALLLARHVLSHGLVLPERYTRTPATFIAEEIAEAGLLKVPTVDLATLQAVDDLTANADMHDQVRAKLKKAIGLALKDRADNFDTEAESAVAGGKPALIAAALDHFERALALNSACGVKKLIEQLRAEAKRLAAPKEPAA